jgi:hypothetical protein
LIKAHLLSDFGETATLAILAEDEVAALFSRKIADTHCEKVNDQRVRVSAAFSGV